MGEPLPQMSLSEMASRTARLEASARRGLECPNCGCRDFQVIKTKPQDGEITRRRACRNCGHRITTMEIPL